MNPRINVGKGVTGAVRYALGEGRDPKTGELNELAPGEDSRVDWIGGTGFAFDVKTRSQADLARREMEFDALNQTSPTRICEQDCMHLSLAWRPGEKPTREQMEEAALSALAVLGMGNAKAIFIAHNDEDYAHVHIVASNINPATGRRYDLEKSWRTLSTWAERFEREHGGIISTRRETANELRAAIAARDADGVLEAITKQKSTFTAAQLENALAKEIRSSADRTQFANQILARPDVIGLAEKPGGPTVRYTTRAVLEAELHVLRAAEGLALNNSHHIGDRQKAAVLNGDKFEGITREQARAFQHATGAEGLAIIDGQAGTGKSFTIAAMREAYEAAGYRVIGLGPTNAVAQDMKADGFGHAATIHSELFALNNGRTSWNGSTAVIVDEAAMLDTNIMAMVTAYAFDAGAKLILVGDDRQLSSIDRGGMFGALKDRHGAAELSEVKRQHKVDERRAAEMMAEGNFHDALGIYDQKGAIHWTRTQPEARAGLVDQWAKDSAAQPEKSRFVFAYTNDDVATLNAALRGVRKERGELGEDHEIDTAHGRQTFAAGDRIQFTATDKRAGIFTGGAGTIEAIKDSQVTVKLDGRQPKTITVDAELFDKFRHGYAGTIYRGQGRTLDQTYLYHSEHWRSASSYVALTRHRDKAELFVAHNTAKDISQLARQMARTDERRAASMFHHEQDIGPVRPLTPSELLARFAGKEFQQQQRGAGGDHARHYNPMPKPPWPSAREQRRPHQQDSRQMFYDLDDERRKRRRAPSAPEFTFEDVKSDPWALVDKPIPRDADRKLLWEALDVIVYHLDTIDWEASRKDPQFTPGHIDDRIKTAEARATELEARLEAMRQPEPGPWPANQNNQPTAEEKETSRLQEPFAEREGRPFQPDAPEPGRYDAMGGTAKQPEPMTLEAIEKDPWNAVALDIPPEANPELLYAIATTARDMRDALGGRAAEAATPEQAQLWSGFAEAALARHKDAATLILASNEPMTEQGIGYDPWTAVYRPIPPDADQALLQQAHDAAMQCAGAVAGPPGPAQPAFAPDLLGADQTREQNFENAVRRLDELDARLKLARAPEPAAEQQQSKAELVGEILSQQGDMHSHYDIGPWDGGFALFRSYEIDDAMLDDYGLPTAQQILGQAETLDEMHEAVINGSAFAVPGQWITDERMEQGSRVDADELSQPLSLDDLAERVQRILDDPTLEQGEHDDRVLEALQERREQDQAAGPVTQDNEREAPAPEPQRDPTAPPQPADDFYERYPGLTRDDDDGDRTREDDEGRGDQGEEGHTIDGGGGGRGRTLQ